MEDLVALASFRVHGREQFLNSISSWSRREGVVKPESIRSARENAKACFCRLFLVLNPLSLTGLLTELVLSSCELYVLHPKVGYLQSLKILNVSRNFLSKLPKEIGNLTRLRELDVSDNQLLNLPFEVGRLTNLRHLNVMSNLLVGLPQGISRLQKLQVLDLGGNMLSTSSNNASLCSLFRRGQFQLLSLFLPGNNLGPNGVRSLCDALLLNFPISITSLDLCANSTGDEGCVIIGQLLRKSNIKSLDLCLNGIGERGASILSEALKDSTSSLTKINLSRNYLIEDFGVQNLHKLCSRMSA